jgi:hypothetical protein
MSVTLVEKFFAVISTLESVTIPEDDVYRESETLGLNSTEVGPLDTYQDALDMIELHMNITNFHCGEVKKVFVRSDADFGNAINEVSIDGKGILEALEKVNGSITAEVK